MQRALEQYADAIPRYDRHQAARSTQQYRLAQDIAFTELERYPSDDEMHLRLVQSTFDMVSHSQAGYTNWTRGTVAGQNGQVNGGLVARPAPSSTERHHRA